MAIKWRNRKGLRPQVILDKLDSCKKVEGDKVSFGAFDKIENEVALATMLDFGDEISVIDKTRMVNGAIFKCAKTTLTEANFIEQINKDHRTAKATFEKEFHLLTSISISTPFVFSKITIGSCTLTFPKAAEFPKKYLTHRKKILRISDSKGDQEKNYCKVIVSITERSSHRAGEKCLDALNILRAFLCFQLNSELTISFGSERPKPINKVILGKYHTLHLTSGEPAVEIYWYEATPTNNESFTIPSEKKPTLVKNLKWYLDQLERLPFKKTLKSSLIRFVNAYDQIDYHSCIVTAWGALESLASSEKEGNNDQISKRCAFLFFENEFHRQLIEHIREYRNNNVHYGESSNDPTIICYQLQRYFRHLVVFYLRNAKIFATKDEANSFLDLPPDTQLLKRRANLIEKAVKFMEPTPKKN